MKFLIYIILICLPFLSFAQKNLSIGQWESHMAFVQGKSITQSETQIFYGTQSAVLVVEKSDLSFQKITKTEGLSSVGVSKVKYHPEQKTLMVIYNDGVIDLLREDGEVTTLFFIRDFNNIVGEKVIYDIHVSGPETFLLAANYGISEINIVRNEFVFTTFTNELDVFGICKYEGYIYAAAADGLYRINENNAFLDAFSQWEYLDAEQGFPADYTPRAIEGYNGKLYFSADTTLYEVDGIAAAPNIIFQSSAPEVQAQYLSAESGRLIIGFADPEIQFTGVTAVLDSNEDNAVSILPFCSSRPLDAVEAMDGRIWMADSYSGFKSYKNGQCTVLEPNSPPSLRNSKMTVHEGDLWVTSGGISLNTSPLGFATGFYSLIDGEWTTYNRDNFPVLAGRTDFTPILVDDNTGEVYAGSHFDGLAVYDGEDISVLEENNSSMTPAVGAGGDFVRVSGLAFDSQNNLWVTNHLGSSPISVRRTDGTWENFTCASTSLIGLTIDDFDYKWIPVYQQGLGFLVFDEKENQCKVYSSNNSELTTNSINVITKDLDGEMWVGTEEGIVIFECGDPFSSDCTGSRRIVEVDGIAANLLKDENIRSITVDGANRKWIGTANGVFVLSPDGRENIAYFSEDNSPLFANRINDIAIDGENGKVYIGTDNGIQALRAEATAGGTVHAESAKVFPNPVRPDYEGPIAISGLATNADVKITDVNGQLIYETTALGGQAVWNGQDYNGRRAASGVYLVFSARTSNLNKNDALVAKILIMN